MKHILHVATSFNSLMNKEQTRLISQVKFFVADIFKKLHHRFAFHNLNHTKEVVKAALKISGHYEIKSNDRFALVLAAWFHDTGFSTGIIEGHEKESKKIAISFLTNQVEDKIIRKVLSCIQATRMPQTPSNIIEKIVCDADLYHLGTNKFLKFSRLLKQEQEKYFNKQISDDEWRQKDVAFLKSHKYFTRYCRQHLEPVKQKWL